MTFADWCSFLMLSDRRDLAVKTLKMNKKVAKNICFLWYPIRRWRTLTPSSYNRRFALVQAVPSCLVYLTNCQELHKNSVDISFDFLQVTSAAPARAGGTVNTAYTFTPCSVICEITNCPNISESRFVLQFWSFCLRWYFTNDLVGGCVCCLDGIITFWHWLLRRRKLTDKQK